MDAKGTTTVDELLGGNGNGLQTMIAFDPKKATVNDIRKLIVTMPGRPPAILDANLAKIYGAKTERLNQQLARNEDWFDSDFYFEMTPDELALANCKRSNQNYPKMFTHYGCNAAAFLLRTPEAYRMRKLIIKVFTELEHSGGIAIKVTDFNQIVRDAIAYRARRTSLTPGKLKRLRRYMAKELTDVEISKLMSASRTTVQYWRKAVTSYSAYAELEDGPQQILLI